MQQTDPKATLANASLRNQFESPLLRLPVELRNKIYGYVLSHDHTGIGLAVRSREYRQTESFRNKRYLSLLAVSRQVYSETKLLPFTLNEICGASMYLHIDIMNYLVTFQVDAISSIRLDVFDPYVNRPNGFDKYRWLTEHIRPDLLQFLGRMRNLRQVTLEFEGGSHDWDGLRAAVKNELGVSGDGIQVVIEN